MEITLNQIGIASGIIVVAVGFITYLVKQSIITYIEERSKNIATKKDISEITRLAEDVKREIEVAKESQIGFQALKREAIVNMFECLLRIYTYFESGDLIGVDRNKAETELDEMNRQLGYAIGRITLFVEEHDEFMENIKEINILFYSLKQRYLKTVDALNLSDGFNRDEIIIQYHKFYSDRLGKYWQQITIIAPKFRALIKG